jgi:hypothetical protein
VYARVRVHSERNAKKSLSVSKHFGLPKRMAEDESGKEGAKRFKPVFTEDAGILRFPLHEPRHWVGLFLFNPPRNPAK